MTPDISIIIPVYNTAAYLPATIASLQALDEGVTYEFVCVDDGSTDESLSILRSWAATDSRVLVLTQPNQGQSVARNIAISNAHGRWIYCLDSDDILEHDALAAAHAEANRLGVGMLLFSGDIIDEAGRHIDEVANTIYTHQRYQRSDELPANEVMTGTEVMETLLRTFSFRAVPWLYLIDADLLRRTGIVFRPGIIHEDELFTATLIMSCNCIATLHRTLVHHRIRKSSTMGATFSRRNMDCYLTVIDGVQEWLHENPGHRQIAWRYCAYTLNHVLITARVLPWNDRLHTLRRIAHSGYMPYLEPKRLLQFIYGK